MKTIINMPFGRVRLRLAFALAWLSANTLFLLIFLNLSKTRNQEKQLGQSAEVFLISADQSLKVLQNEYVQSAYYIKKYGQTGDKKWLDKLNNSVNNLNAYSPILNYDISIDSIKKTESQLSYLIQERIRNIENVIDISRERGAGPAVAYLQQNGIKDSNGRVSALTRGLSGQYHSLIVRNDSLISNAFQSANQPFIILLVFFNILFPVTYLTLKRSIKKLEERDQYLEQEVEKKAAELSKVYERITDSFIALDNEWRYTYVNENATDLHGLKPNDLIGKSIFDIFPEVVNEPFYHALHEAKTTQKSLRLELYFSKTGQWFEDLIYPTQDGISVYYHDITEKKKAIIALQESEASLKKSYEQFNLVSKATTDALWDWDIRQNKIMGNQFFNELLHVPSDKSVQWEFFLEHIHPEDTQRVMNNYDQLAHSKATYWSDEFRFRKADGSYRTMYNRAYLLYDQEGRHYRMVGAMQDITNLQLARRQLMIEKELSDSIINSLPGIFYLYNRAGHLYLWNKNFEEVSGYSREEISKLHPLDFFSDPEKELLTEKIANVFNNGKDYVEANFLTKSGKLIPYYFNGRLINYEGEDCLVGLGIDITEKVKAHDELRQLATHLQHVRENERTHIAREIHDELGQQLTGLKMDISWLSKKLGNVDDQVAIRLNDIIQLIDETVKTVRRISTELRPSILDDLGLVAAMEWQSDEFEKRSEITTDFTSNVASIQLPTDMVTGLFRIFQECLTNVMRHSKASHIEARLHVRDGNLTLQVRDNGEGFDPTAIGQKKTLGLLGIKERTSLMGGVYKIKSRPGSGTEVEISVPVPQSIAI